ncbi:membrane-bound lytic murein transglycosylase MltC [Proteus vulgaris]|uniref:membrane-bound lytic murein transglycosylase MltC n=1 Tax=Proteus vulgaris TaxID=585 RepID=UPI0023605DFF|nr:membrane-bound lytic murein transglycosylase MltC [Proteus vulgaris]
MKKILLLLIIAPLLISCSSQPPKTFEPDYAKDTNAFDILMGQFANNIEMIWGMKEVLIAGPKDYVKYTDAYKTRSHINFEAGTITIETLGSDAPQFQLHKAIVTTLLMGEDPGSIDLYSDVNNIPHSTEPFLSGQVLDNTGQPIRWEWRANKFADYLIANKLQKRQSGINTIWYVTINLVPNHLDKRAHKYLPLVQQAAAKYGVEPSLILAIMQIESSFNPYAVSSSDALGLMQIMPATAGRDVFRMQGKSGQPSRSYLFDPANNIDAGAAYISILQNSYLGDIKDPISRRYAVIQAYNGGAGSVLRIFHSDKKQAAAMINNLEPTQVYTTLRNKHPADQSRRYLEKVSTAQRNYR